MNGEPLLLVETVARNPRWRYNEDNQCPGGTSMSIEFLDQEFDEDEDSEEFDERSNFKQAACDIDPSDSRFDGIRLALSGDISDFVREFDLLDECSRYHLIINDSIVGIPPVSDDPRLREMLSWTIMNHDLGENLFSLCADCHRDFLHIVRIVGKVIFNPNLPVEMMPQMFPFRNTIENLGADDASLLSLFSRWDDVSSFISDLTFDDYPGTRREMEALIRLATRMRISLRKGDFSEAMRIAISAGDSMMYQDAIRFSSPQPLIFFDTQAYEAHLLMKSGTTPSMLRGLRKSGMSPEFSTDDEKVKALRKFVASQEMSSQLIELINGMSRFISRDEIDEMVIEYARQVDEVMGGFEEFEKKNPSDVEIVEWLVSSDHFIIAIMCSMRDNRIETGHISLATALSYIAGEWGERSKVISEIMCGYDDEMFLNMTDPSFLKRQIERYGGLSRGPVTGHDLYDDIFDGSGHDIVFYHGTSASRFTDGFPEKGIHPIDKVGLLSPVEMGTEDYEDRKYDLDLVFMSNDPDVSSSYAWKTTSQDLVRGIETKPVILVIRVSVEDVFDNLELDYVFDSLASALVKISSPNQIIPSVVTKRSIHRDDILGVVDISSIEEGGRVCHLFTDDIKPRLRTRLIDGLLEMSRAQFDEDSPSSMEFEVLDMKPKMIAGGEI